MDVEVEEDKEVRRLCSRCSMLKTIVLFTQILLSLILVIAGIYNLSAGTNLKPLWVTFTVFPVGLLFPGPSFTRLQFVNGKTKERSNS